MNALQVISDLDHRGVVNLKMEKKAEGHTC